MKVLILSVDGFEDFELIYFFYRIKEEGYEVYVVSFQRGKIMGKYGYMVNVDFVFDEVDLDEFDVLVFFGGRVLEIVRLNEKVVVIMKKMFEDGKLVVSICYGLQIFIFVGVLKGRKGMSMVIIRDDVKNVGVEWIDVEVVVDGNWVSLRYLGDLYVWMREFVKFFR